MHVSPVLVEVGTYPFVRLDEAKRRLTAAGIRFIDFGLGDPREPTAPFIREALAAGIRETMEYPRAAGLPETRAAIAGWVERRF
ncbi:MAG TPA: succinyldiaminopimelate transaminase, partial [Planctomycetota bacterium]|nr:succinyldiaminopimelate transaminase [Planctomycetota bacterium]